MKKQYTLDIYFGIPGSGKTTLAAYFAKKARRRKIPVYSNVPITGTYELDVHRDIGTFQIDNAMILIDEAGVEYNNRNYKNLPQHEILFYKYFRHYKNSIAVFSQSYDDMDITLRRLATSFFLVKRSLLPWFVSVRRIGRKIGIDEQTKSIIDQFFFVPLGRKYIFCPPLWKMFNTYSHKPLKLKDWPKW